RGGSADSVYQQRPAAFMDVSGFRRPGSKLVPGPVGVVVRTALVPGILAQATRDSRRPGLLRGIPRDHHHHSLHAGRLGGVCRGVPGHGGERPRPHGGQRPLRPLGIYAETGRGTSATPRDAWHALHGRRRREGDAMTRTVTSACELREQTMTRRGGAERADDASFRTTRGEGQAVTGSAPDGRTACLTQN